ncbi:TPA: hypothetical protein ACH3X2_008880 [Trebouxia sp. C0005]
MRERQTPVSRHHGTVAASQAAESEFKTAYTPHDKLESTLVNSDPRKSKHTSVSARGTDQITSNSSNGISTAGPTDSAEETQELQSCREAGPGDHEKTKENGRLSSPHANSICDFLPGEGNTIETGSGLRTGGRSFFEVGQMLFRLLGTMVACYTAHEDDGAYTVWLLCPSKATRRHNQLCFACCSSHITWQHISAGAGYSIAQLIMGSAFMTAPKDQHINKGAMDVALLLRSSWLMFHMAEGDVVSKQHQH